MNDVNVWAILVAAVAVLVVSTVWYSGFSKQMAELSPAYADAAANARPPAWKVALEHVRTLRRLETAGMGTVMASEIPMTPVTRPGR